MAANDHRDDLHAQAEELLPWYSTGQLDGKDRMLVERHLASCVACQRQLRFDQRMIEELETLDPNVESGWNRLRSKLELEERGRNPVERAVGTAWNLLRQPAVATLAAAQLAFVIIAGAMFLSVSRPDYRTLSDPTEPSRANVIVVFRDDTTQKDILNTLRASDATMVGGPTAAGAYLLQVKPQHRGETVKRLRANHDVQMAQLIDGSAQ